MKKKVVFSIIAISVLLIISFTLYLIFNYRKGNVKNAEIVIGDSQIYTKEEIQSAIDIVLDRFETLPAKLYKIWYDEEKSLKESEKWKEQYNADEAIVLYSNFKTYPGKQSLNNGFNSNFKYENWNWVLVRNNKEKWEIKTFGY